MAKWLARHTTCPMASLRLYCFVKEASDVKGSARTMRRKTVNENCVNGIPG